MRIGGLIARVPLAAQAAGLVLALAALFFGRDFLLGRTVLVPHDLFFSDVLHFHEPLRHWAAQELSQGRLPLWCPLVGSGFPIFSEGQIGALYPPNLLLYGLLPFSLASAWALLLHLVLAGVFAALLARRLGAGRAGALLAAAVWPFSAPLILHLKHPNLVSCAAWLPALLLATHLLLQVDFDDGFVAYLNGVRVAALAAVVGLMLLCGHPQTTVNSLLLAGLWALVRLIALARSREGRAAGRAAGRLALGGVLGLGLGLPQLLPTLELQARSNRQGGLTDAQAGAFEMRPSDLLLLVDPGAYGDSGRLEPRPGTGELVGFQPPGGPRIFEWEVSGFVGRLVLLLGLLALALRVPAAWALLAALLPMLLLALGPHGGVEPFLRWALPGYSAFRVPSRALLQVSLLLTLLGALGLRPVLAGLRRALPRARGPQPPGRRVPLGQPAAHGQGHPRNHGGPRPAARLEPRPGRPRLLQRLPPGPRLARSPAL